MSYSASSSGPHRWFVCRTCPLGLITIPTSTPCVYESIGAQLAIGAFKPSGHLTHTVLELSWVHILLPGYLLTNTRRVPGYPFIRCRMFSALNQDQDCQNRPARSKDISKFLHQSLWNWPLTSFRALLWLFSRVFTPLAPQVNCSSPLWMLVSAQVEAIGVKMREKWPELAWYWVVQCFKWVPG